LLVIFILTGVMNRARKGLISGAVWYQSQLASYWMTWVVVAFLLGAIVTTFMVESPNTDPAIFGGFKQQ
jgi:type II secretory pathway component PulL